MSERILILGASARAAAFSTRRAGWAAVAGDLFADEDLAACCPATRVVRYPDGLMRVTRDAPPGPWLYTGALENYPELVDRIRRQRTLYGNAGDVLRQVRDPLLLAAALRADELAHPAVSRYETTLSRDMAWLRKPLRSSGGGRISVVDLRVPVTAERWAAHHAEGGHYSHEEDVVRHQRHGDARSGWYFQQRIDGMACSAVYVAAGGRSELLGVTRQLIGTPWTGATGWRYAGSLGPIRLARDRRQTWQRIGRCVSRRFDLSGLFGVDAIVGDDDIWPVEVNPRYTASVEILERAMGIHAISLHVAACRDGRLPERVPEACRSWHGKAILFARERVKVSRSFWRQVRRERACVGSSDMADLPAEGSLVDAGRPVLTVFAEAASPTDLEEQLRSRANRLWHLLSD